MTYIKIGKIIKTHGIKGELRILSTFDKKEKIFKKNFNIYIGTNKIKETITTYRPHKEFDMITLANYNNINQVLKYIKEDVYILRKDLNLSNNEYLLQDLIGLKINENNETLGIVEDVIDAGKNNILLKIKGPKNFYIPKNNNYIKNIDIQNKTITTQNTKGLIL